MKVKQPQKKSESRTFEKVIENASGAVLDVRRLHPAEIPWGAWAEQKESADWQVLQLMCFLLTGFSNLYIFDGQNFTNLSNLHFFDFLSLFNRLLVKLNSSLIGWQFPKRNINIFNSNVFIKMSTKLESFDHRSKN